MMNTGYEKIASKNRVCNVPPPGVNMRWYYSHDSMELLIFLSNLIVQITKFVRCLNLLI